MFMPYGTGALLVRNGNALRAAHAMTAGYLPEMPSAEEFYDPSQHGPDLSRGFPGLRMWLTIKIYGADAFRAAIAEKRALAVDAAARVARLPHVVMDAPPELSLFPFHLTWPGATLAQEDDATRAVMDVTSKKGRVMLSGSVAGGRYVGRVCVLSFRTHAPQIDALVEDLEAAIHDVVGRYA
jgi:aromatic-L-amino-acid decarboxylase